LPSQSFNFVSAQATNARRSISWPLAANALPVRRPSTISCGFITS
jgi:hypothetical protein